MLHFTGEPNVAALEKEATELALGAPEVGEESGLCVLAF
jgi:hypothetical protein